jgi:predicted CopG family antitoxin
MTDKRKAITVRVQESVYKKFQQMCMEEKRSMSSQGELLIEQHVSGGDVLWFGKDDEKIEDHVKRMLEQEID